MHNLFLSLNFYLHCKRGQLYTFFFFLVLVQENVTPHLLPTTGRSIHNGRPGHRHGAGNVTRQKMAKHRLKDTTRIIPVKSSDDIITRVLGAGSWRIKMSRDRGNPLKKNNRTSLSSKIV